MNERCKGVLKMFRERAGLTQEEAACELCISIHALSNYESYSLEVSKNLPSDEMILRMSDLYQSDFMKILFLNEQTSLSDQFFLTLSF